MELPREFLPCLAKTFTPEAPLRYGKELNTDENKVRVMKKKKDLPAEGSHIKERPSSTIELIERPVSEFSKIVLIETNRWVPDKCLWLADKSLLSESTVLLFPFPELSLSMCHIFVGTADRYKCFIHLTPLTSLFRSSTNELEKITANLAEITRRKLGWKFKIYYFDDQGREQKFRDVISTVLGRRRVTFIQMHPKDYKQGEINLLYCLQGFFYSTQDTKLLLSLNDASTIGSYNKIPIFSYE